MTEREQLILRAILLALKDAGAGRQMTDPVLHATAALKVPNLILDEFEEQLRRAETERWIHGIRSQVTGNVKWSLSDAGRAALKELQG